MNKTVIIETEKNPEKMQINTLIQSLTMQLINGHMKRYVRIFDVEWHCIDRLDQSDEIQIVRQPCSYLVGGGLIWLLGANRAWSVGFCGLASLTRDMTAWQQKGAIAVLQLCEMNKTNWKIKLKFFVSRYIFF